jgi:hypothetical protein
MGWPVDVETGVGPGDIWDGRDPGRLEWHILGMKRDGVIV